VLQELLEAEMTEHVGAAPYERVEGRTGHRNGHKPRTLRTRVGTLTLLVPQDREGTFSTKLFSRYRRNEVVNVGRANWLNDTLSLLRGALAWRHWLWQVIMTFQRINQQYRLWTQPLTSANLHASFINQVAKLRLCICFR
jgi:hypothetical protein